MQVGGVAQCKTGPLRVRGEGRESFEEELGEYSRSGGCHKVPLDTKVSNGTIRWVGEGKWEAESICLEWMDKAEFPFVCKIRRNMIKGCKMKREYRNRECPTSTTTTTTTPPPATSPSHPRPTIQQGHTLLRKVVVDTATCKKCSDGALVMQLWGADDALDVYNCTSRHLKFRGVGKTSFERELGEYTLNGGCHQAPLDARVSDGNVRWVGHGRWKAVHVCFEWLDWVKFPMDCSIHNNKIGNCKPNRSYAGLKCPTK